MKRTHAFLIAVALGIAVVAGTFAALRSQQLARTAGPRISSNQYASQTRALDRAEAAIKAELRRRPPAVPALTVAPPARAPQAVIYRRPAPIVQVIHRHGGEHEAESHDDGGGFDD
jgi:hypothetical protein